MVQQHSKSKKIHNAIHTAEEGKKKSVREHEHMAEGAHTTTHTRHLTSIGNKRTHHQAHKLPAPLLLYILLNPHPLEADGLNCRVASIFKLDILVIS